MPWIGSLPPVPLYAAYGSNLDPRRMGERCPHSPLRGTGWLTGWRLTFGGEEHGWDGALATIVEDPLEQVFVALYDVTGEDEEHLDGWEGADTGLYRKIRVRVSHADRRAAGVDLRARRLRGRAALRAATSGSSPTPPRPPTPPTTTSRALRARPCRSIGVLTRRSAGVRVHAA